MNHLVAHIVECCNRLGVSHEATFRRNAEGNLGRKYEDCINRWAVWYLAFAWRGKMGRYSYPEVAAGSQLKGHTTVIDGVRRMAHLIEMVRRVNAAMKQLKKEGQVVIPPIEYQP